MRTYEGWTFRDRSFLKALVLSSLWHLFWFFSLNVVVMPLNKNTRSHLRVVSLGTAFDDRVLRTLVNTRPQASQTFYRRLSDYHPAKQQPIAPIPAQTPGRVVGLPLDQKMGVDVPPIGDDLLPVSVPGDEGSLGKKFRLRSQETN